MNCGIFITAISLWNKKKRAIDTWNNIDEPQMQYVEWRKPGSKATCHMNLLYDTPEKAKLQGHKMD